MELITVKFKRIKAGHFEACEKNGSLLGWSVIQRGDAWEVEDFDGNKTHFRLVKDAKKFVEGCF